MNRANTNAVSISSVHMVTINSILGDLDTGDLGFTLTREHVGQSAAGINAGLAGITHV